MNTTKILQDRIRIAFAPAADPSVLVPPSAEELLDLDLAQRLAVIRGTIRGRVVFTTSFGIEDQAIAHAIFRQALTIDVVTLDTGRLFPQTYELWAQTERRYGLSIPWQKPPSKRPRQILLPLNASRSDVRPEQFERRARLVSAIARGRRWLDDVVSGRVTTVAEICTREKCSVRRVNMTISLAFLAPNLVRAAVEGRLPRGIGIERLRDPPTEWSRQFEALGLNPE